MTSNHKLTSVPQGRTVSSPSNQGSTLTIHFTDSSSMTLMTFADGGVIRQRDDRRGGLGRPAAGDDAGDVVREGRDDGHSSGGGDIERHGAGQGQGDGVRGLAGGGSRGAG